MKKIKEDMRMNANKRPCALTVCVPLGLPSSGDCPKCGSGRLVYATIQPTDDGIEYVYRCPDCKTIGSEVYEFRFVKHDLFSFGAGSKRSKKR